MIEVAVEQLSPLVGMKAACEALGRPRASHYRAHPVSPAAPPTETSELVKTPSRQLQPRGLSDVERKTVLDVLHSERFVDTAPAEIYATLLDEGHPLVQRVDDVSAAARAR